MMKIKAKVRGFICISAHPEGCAKQVKNQIDYVKKQPAIKKPKKVLVIGASTGYGLASRIVATFGCKADTIGVFYEKPATDKRTASAGWYNTVAFEEYANNAGNYAASINGDAFSNEVKQQVIDLIKNKLGKVDLVIYSLASPRRIHPDTKEVLNSALRTINQPYTEKSLDPMTGEIKTVTVTPATEEEINHTVEVMGGDDWSRWIDQLYQAGVLAEGIKTVAYSYLGPELTYPIYRQGTIGKAKEHLEQTALHIHQQLQALQGEAYVSINKALVTQASAAIPIVPLYISLLYKVMKQKGIHEGCIEQIYRLFQRLYEEDSVKTDDKHRIRLDDLEMRDDVQQTIQENWHQVNKENIIAMTDILGYRKDFYNLFGFEVDGIDYEQEVDPNRNIPSIACLPPEGNKCV